MRPDGLLAVGHQGADHGRRQPEVGHLVALDQRPHPVRCREVGGALVDDESRAEEERAGDRPRAHHPAEVGEPEERVALGQIERMREVLRGLDRESAMDVDGALRPTGRARGVDDHVRRLGVAVRCGPFVRSGAFVRLVLGVRPQDVAPLCPRHVERVASAGHDEHALHRRRGLDCGVRDRLEIDPCPAAQEPIRGDEQLRLAVGEARRDRRGAVAREDRREDRPDAADGQHRDDGLDQHRQQDPDPVALGDAEGTEVSCGTPDELSEITVRHVPVRPGFALPCDRDPIGVSLRARLDRRPRPVEGTAGPPARPRRPVAEIRDLTRPTRPGDRDVVGRGAPEPRRVRGGASLQVVERRLAGRSQEPGQAGLGCCLGVGSPRDAGRVAAEDRPVIGAR